jgi:hypothetical protein
VRDPWFPVALMLIVVGAVWLSILGPMPDGFAAWLQKWQTITALAIAMVGAAVAIQNTTRSLRHSEKLESTRRSRKQAAVRAVLPLALSQITDYAERSAQALNELVTSCNGESLPAQKALDIIPELPTETLKTLSEFIEYSDTVNVGIIESTVALMQIHDSRIRALIMANRDPLSTRIVVRTEIEARIVDAASIYAGAAAGFEYARRRQGELPLTLSWEAVGAALRNMQFWDDEHPRLHEMLIRREGLSAGPFEALAPGGRIR